MKGAYDLESLEKLSVYLHEDLTFSNLDVLNLERRPTFLFNNFNGFMQPSSGIEGDK